MYGGDFLANQPPVKAMCDAAPGIIDLLDRMGVPFNRTPEGLLDFRRFGGTLYNRTAFAGATTGQQLLYALDEQVRRYESEGKVNKYEALGIPLGRPRRQSASAAASAPWIFARWRSAPSPPTRSSLRTGGIGAIFGKSTNSVVCTGSAQSASVSAGLLLRERRIHPGSSDVDSRRRQAAPDVGIGARRRWTGLGSARQPATSAIRKTIPESERWYFLEEWYPKYGNLVPRDVATRADFQSRLRARPRHRRQADGLPGPHPH